MQFHQISLQFDRCNAIIVQEFIDFVSWAMGFFLVIFAFLPFLFRIISLYRVLITMLMNDEKKTLLNVCSVCEFFLDLTLLYLHTQRSDTSNFNTIWVVSCTILYDSRQECEVNVISVFICFWEEFSLDHRFHFAVRIRFVCQMGSMQQTHVCEITSTVVSLSLFRILTCALRHILNRTTIVRSHY